MRWQTTPNPRLRLRYSATQVELQVWEWLWRVFESKQDLPEARQSIPPIADHLTRSIAAGWPSARHGVFLKSACPECYASNVYDLCPRSPVMRTVLVIHGQEPHEGVLHIADRTRGVERFSPRASTRPKAIHQQAELACDGRRLSLWHEGL